MYYNFTHILQLLLRVCLQSTFKSIWTSTINRVLKMIKDRLDWVLFPKHFLKLKAWNNSSWWKKWAEFWKVKNLLFNLVPTDKHHSQQAPIFSPCKKIVIFFLRFNFHSSPKYFHLLLRKKELKWCSEWRIEWMNARCFILNNYVSQTNMAGFSMLFAEWNVLSREQKCK